MGPRVTVDKDRCISSGKCVADEPGVFTFDDDELSEVRDGAAPLPIERLVAIARRCPGEAIAVFDERGMPVELG